MGDLEIHDLILERGHIRDKWSEISDTINVPKTIYDHQADTMALLLARKNVLCALPTGGGKTLAQLASVFVTGGTALVIPPLLTIEKQMSDICQEWQIAFVNLSSFSDPNEIQLEVETKKPRIILASIEKISDLRIRKGLVNVRLDYVALDEAQVLDPETGWVKIRPYCQETWSFLRARFKCPLLLMSATMEENSLQRICDNLDILRDELKVLYKSPDRTNIYEQRRICSKPIDVSNVHSHLIFLIPAFVDCRFVKCQIFCTTRNMTDLVAAFLKTELRRISALVELETVPGIEKLTGDSSKVEKERVMEIFKDGLKQVLVCTDVAGMGVDNQDLDFSLSLGIPKNSWKWKQQSGRIGRSGRSALNITFVFPQKGVSAPEPVLRKALRGSHCIRRAINELFVLSLPLVDYTETREMEDCNLDCDEECVCQLCLCCSVCSEQCRCSSNIKDENEKMLRMFQFGDENYRKVEAFYKTLVLSDQSDDSEEESTEDVEEIVYQSF